MYIFTDASTNQTDGTSGVGFVVKNDACKRIYSGSQALMCANNNSAELWAIAYCCQLLSEAGFFKSKQDVHFFVDSKTALKSLQNSNPADDLSLEALQHIETYLFHRGADNHIGRISFYQTCGHYRCTVPFIAKGNHEADRLAAKARKELELFLTHKKGPVVSFDMKKKDILKANRITFWKTRLYALNHRQKSVRFIRFRTFLPKSPNNSNRLCKIVLNLYTRLSANDGVSTTIVPDVP